MDMLWLRVSNPKTKGDEAGVAGIEERRVPEARMAQRVRTAPEVIK